MQSIEMLRNGSFHEKASPGNSILVRCQSPISPIYTEKPKASHLKGQLSGSGLNQSNANLPPFYRQSTQNLSQILKLKDSSVLSARKSSSDENTNVNNTL